MAKRIALVALAAALGFGITTGVTRQCAEADSPNCYRLEPGQLQVNLGDSDTGRTLVVRVTQQETAILWFASNS